MNQTAQRKQVGLTLIETLITLSIASIIIVLVSSVINQALQARKVIEQQNDLTRQTRFAMQQMVQAVSQTRLLLVPMQDKPATPFIESIREQTVPASPPPIGSSNASAVLAVTLSLGSDLNTDGYPDADNDKDGLVDEDLPADIHNDSAAGIVGIDDDGAGGVDGVSVEIFGFTITTAFPVDDDDESGPFSVNEDNLNNQDDDNDGLLDEDPGGDNNGDGCPGICFVDDDNDGSIDDGSNNDDDEDGSSDEDWYDSVVFYLEDNNLLQRTPVPWDEDESGVINGLDFIEEIIATNVSHLRIERLEQNQNRQDSINIFLELTSPLTNDTFSLNSQVRVGGQK